MLVALLMSLILICTQTEGGAAVPSASKRGLFDQDHDGVPDPGGSYPQHLCGHTGRDQCSGGGRSVHLRVNQL
jgi:hypothetical protein